MAQLNEKELFESVPVPKAVARLIVPTIISQIVTVIYNLADTFFIGRIDALFANAGIMPAGNMSELKTDDWARMVEINIMGVLNSMAAVLPRFIAQKRGHIVVTPPSRAQGPCPATPCTAAQSTLCAPCSKVSAPNAWRKGQISEQRQFFPAQ